MSKLVLAFAIYEHRCVLVHPRLWLASRVFAEVSSKFSE